VGDRELPIYLRILAGAGAFIASLCILGFLDLAKVINFDSGVETISWGVMFIAGGILLAKGAARNAGIALHSFLMQWSFCAVGLGKILAVMGAMKIASHDYMHNNDMWYATWVLTVVTAVTWPFYRMSVDRFLSSAAVLIMLMFDILGDHRLDGSKNLLIEALLIAEVGLAGFIFTNGKAPRGFQPLGYALAVAVAGITLFYSAHIQDYALREEIFTPAIIDAVLAGALVWLTGWAAGGPQRMKLEPYLIAALGAVALALMGAPGVLLSVCLMLLGYARHDRKLISGGAVMAPVFIWLYYYNLKLTLIAKALVLAGSGLVLLAGRAYMRLRKLDKEA
jgi:hypothetical protein